jgi:hypothetical protein
MKQTFSIKKQKGKWLIVDNTEPLDIPFDDGGEGGFTKEECIQTCINLNSVPESDQEEQNRETRTREFFSMFPPAPFNSVKEEETVFDLLVGAAKEEARA